MTSHVTDIRFHVENIPWHSTSGSPQNSSLHSLHVLPPKPGWQEHWPLICGPTRTRFNGLPRNPLEVSEASRRRGLAHLVAGRSVRVFGVTVTGLTAGAARHVPGVGSATVTVLTDHIWEAATLTAAAVAVTVAGWWTAGGLAAQMVTDALWGRGPDAVASIHNAWLVFIYLSVFSTGLPSSILTPAVLQHGVSIVTHFAALAGGPLAVIQAAQTLAGSGVAGLRVQHVNVVVALTGKTLSAHLARVSVVTRWALVAAGTCREKKLEEEIIVWCDKNGMKRHDWQLSSLSGWMDTVLSALTQWLQMMSSEPNKDFSELCFEMFQPIRRHQAAAPVENFFHWGLNKRRKFVFDVSNRFQPEHLISSSNNRVAPRSCSRPLFTSH